MLLSGIKVGFYSYSKFQQQQLKQCQKLIERENEILADTWSRMLPVLNSSMKKYVPADSFKIEYQLLKTLLQSDTYSMDDLSSRIKKIIQNSSYQFLNQEDTLEKIPVAVRKHFYRHTIAASLFSKIAINQKHLIHYQNNTVALLINSIESYFNHFSIECQPFSNVALQLNENLQLKIDDLTIENPKFPYYHPYPFSEATLTHINPITRRSTVYEFIE